MDTVPSSLLTSLLFGRSATFPNIFAPQTYGSACSVKLDDVWFVSPSNYSRFLSAYMAFLDGF